MVLPIPNNSRRTTHCVTIIESSSDASTDPNSVRKGTNISPNQTMPGGLLFNPVIIVRAQTVKE
jgi:hypothetical protein